LIALDLAADRLPGTRHGLDMSHLAFGAVIVLSSVALMRWAVRKQKSVESVLRQAHDELETRVSERTADLEAVNQALQVEVAERQRVERALRTSEETARAMMDASSESALLLDLHGGVLACNAISAQRLGVPVERLVGASLLDFFPPDVALRRRAHLDTILRTGQAVHFIDERAGRTYDSHVYPVSDANGTIIRLAAFSRDITERQQIEDELRASEEKYRLLFQNMAEGFALYELLYDAQGEPADWRILEVNDAYTHHTGIPADQIVGQRASELFPAAIPEYLPRFSQVVASQVPIAFETYAQTIHRHQRVFTFPAGGHRFANTIEDITERKQAVEALRASEEKFATVFGHSPEAIAIVHGASGELLDVNEAFASLTGYARSEAIGRRWDGLALLLSTAAQNQMATLLRQQGVMTDYELAINTKQGEVSTVLLSVMAIHVSGEPCLLAIAHDITLRKQAEQALRRAAAELATSAQQRAALEERQRLARDLHDSVSQVFYGISLGVHTALAMLDTDRDQVNTALSYTLALVDAGLTEMRALIFELRPELLEEVGLVAALTTHAASLRARYDVQIEQNLCDEPELALKAKEALFRIAQEALQNAIKHAHADRLEIRLICQPDSLVLEVCDNGVGFDPGVAYPGHLGLRSMQERMRALGGTLKIHSAPRQGTQVEARFAMPVDRLGV
jgi:PAS domain S-box-containing protein